MPQPNIIAQRVPRELRAKATELANTVTEKITFALHTDRYREHCNYGYWETLSELEQTRTAVAARRQIYDAENMLMKGDLEKAIPSFEAGWKNWDKLLRKYPMIVHDEVCDRLLKSIDRYANAATEGTLPNDFPLNWFYRYRAIRDKNKAGEETFRMYEGFLDESKSYDAQLDMPFEMETASPATERGSGGKSDKSSAGEDRILNRNVPKSIGNSLDSPNENPIVNEKDVLNSEAGAYESRRTPPPLEAPLQ